MSTRRSVAAHGRSTTPGIGRQIGVAIALLLIVASIAAAGSLATIPNTDGWYAEVQRAPWSPPDAVFGPVWSVLYVLIALVGFLLWRSGFSAAGEPNAARAPLTLFVIQLVLNALWTPVFFAGYPVFGQVAWWAALVVIAALVVALGVLIPVAWRHSRTASVLLVPYLLWVAFASSLNVAIIALN